MRQGSLVPVQRRMLMVARQARKGEVGKGGKSTWHRAKGRWGPRGAWCRRGGMPWARRAMLVDMLFGGQRVSPTLAHLQEALR